MISCGLLMGLVMVLAQSQQIQFDSYLIFSDKQQQLRLFISYILYFIPFFTGALAIGLIFIKRVEHIGKFYFANLLGSGAGGILALGMISSLMPATLSALAGMLPVVAGLFITTSRFSITRIYAILSLFILVFLFLYPPKLSLSQFKSLSKTLNLPDSEIMWKKTSHHGLMQLVSAPALRFAPGISLAYTEPIPVVRGVFNNGNWFGPLLFGNQLDTLMLMRYTTNNLPYVISSPRKVLILNARTGLEIDHALKNGSKEVVGIEPHTLIPPLLKHFQVKWFEDNRVNFVTSEPRSYLRRDTSSYDLIVIPTLNSFGGNSGLNALEQQYVLTTENIKDLWNKLTDKGAISITVWMDYPARYALKVLSSFSESLRQMGIRDVEKHVIAIRNWGTITFLIQRTPINFQEKQRIVDFCDEMMFDPLLLPGYNLKDREVYNLIQDKSLKDNLQKILSGDYTQFVSEYDFNVNPTSDDRPYFYQFLKLQSIARLSATFGNQLVPYFELGYLIVILTFFQIILAGLFLIILPLFKIGWKGDNKAKVLLYFGALGLGFMFVEMVLIQQFTLYLGHPIYATALVITALLVLSGIGSYRSENIVNIKSKLIRILMSITLLLIIYAFILTPVLQITISLSLVWKILIFLIIIAPVAYLLGMPFPVALKYYTSANNLPWAWGINGYFSVVSAVSVVILSVEFGFVTVMIIAALAYFLALSIAWYWKS